MNVFKISRGRSFKGLTAYMSGGKDGTERAVWSLAMNCGTDNVQTAAKVMAFTAEHAEQIKDAARAEGHQIGKGGVKKHGPVLHLAISWEAGETPSPEQQQHAARDLLKALGLEQAQAVAVAHNDTDHAHLHMAVNLIRPDLGTQWSMDDDLRKMSAWADQYARDHGFAVTPGRAANAERRAQGEEVKSQSRLSRDEYDRMQVSGRDSWAAASAQRGAAFTAQAADRADLRTKHNAEWKAAKSDAAVHRKAHDQLYRAALSAAKAADKVNNKPVWRAVFQRQKADTLAASQAVWTAEARHKGAQDITRNARRLLALSERFERSIIARKILAPLGFKVSADGQRATLKDAQNREAEAKAGATAAKVARDGLEARHEAERKATAATLTAATEARVKAAIQAVNPVDFGAMVQRQNEERRRQIEHQNAERAALGMKPYQPRSKEAPMSDYQLNDEKRDHARRDFMATVDRRAPQQSEAKSQGAGYVPHPPTPDNPRPGSTPLAPEPNKRPPTPQVGQTAFKPDQTKDVPGYNLGRRRADRQLPDSPQNSPTDRSPASSFKAATAAAKEKANSPEAKAADLQRRAAAVAKAKTKKHGMDGPDM